jgi:hypothetical protein
MFYMLTAHICIGIVFVHYIVVVNGVSYKGIIVLLNRV